MYPGQRNLNSIDGGPTEYLLVGCDSYDGNPQSRSRILREVNEVIATWTSLQPQTDVFYNNDGTKQTLVVLKGTVPIFYNGAQYNIPMSFWFTTNFPLSPPHVFITPTSTMQIDRNHDYVSPDGTVYLPYLNEWNPSTGSLNEVISTCKTVFSNFPPVRSKEAKASNPSPSIRNNSPHYPLTQSPPITNRPPPYNAHASSQQMGTSNLVYSPHNPYQIHTKSRPPPPYPVPRIVGNNSMTATQPSDGYNYEIEIRNDRELKTIRQAMRIKMETEYNKFRETMKKAVNEKIVTQKQLENGGCQILEAKKSLESQAKALEDSLLEIETNTTVISTWIDEYAQVKEGDNMTDKDAIEQLDLDDSIIPVDTPSRQLFDCVSEINAVDDVLYFLDKGLANDAINLSTFLKHVRKLARMQFMAKALANKIQAHQQMVEEQKRQFPPALNSRPPAYYPK